MCRGSRPIQALSCLLAILVLSEARTVNLATRLEELLDFHTELKGSDLHLAIQQANPENSESQSGNSIPQIIHQTWKNHSIPDLYKEWSASWTKVNPTWLHILWSDDENLRLVREHYPTFLPAYLGLPTNISRADAARPLILHRYGGVYSDLDSQALRPLDTLLAGLEVVLARMGNDNEFQHSIPNAFMASRPQEDFLLFFVRHIQRVQEGIASHRSVPSTETIAGPVALKAAVDAYLEVKPKSQVTILPPGLIYPVNWAAKKHGLVPAVCDWGRSMQPGRRREFNATECISIHHPHAYSVQWWTHSWR